MFGNSITKFLKLDNLIENLTGFVETKVELVKVDIKEDLAKGLGTAVNYIIVSFVFALVILFLSLGVAIALADQLGTLAGFSIVALFYLVVGVILLINRKKLSDKLTKQFAENFKKKK
jgi:uncharacterized membrane protein YqjE